MRNGKPDRITDNGIDLVSPFQSVLDRVFTYFAAISLP